MGKSWRRALVTGASSGIGETFARMLAARGADLVLVARRGARLEALADELVRSHGIEAEVLVADLTDPERLRVVEERLGSTDRPTDLLVNNAGGSDHGGRGAFADLPRGLVTQQAALNAIAVLRLTHAAVVAMKNRGAGNVIQVSAGVAFYPVPYGATYAASKAFVNSFSEAVDYELRRSGVRITVVCPGFTRTEAPGRIGFSEENVPRSFWADPEEVVKAALVAAEREKTVVSPTLVDKIGAAFGGHFPHAMMKMATGLTGKQPARG